MSRDLPASAPFCVGLPYPRLLRDPDWLLGFQQSYLPRLAAGLPQQSYLHSKEKAWGRRLALLISLLLFKTPPPTPSAAPHTLSHCSFVSWSAWLQRGSSNLFSQVPYRCDGIWGTEHSTVVVHVLLQARRDVWCCGPDACDCSKIQKGAEIMGVGQGDHALVKDFTELLLCCQTFPDLTP